LERAAFQEPVDDRAARTDRQDDVKIPMFRADRLRVFAEKP
jgi:hypothetical protein